MNILIICNIYHASPRIPSLIKYLSKNNKIYLLTPEYQNKDQVFGPRIDLSKFSTVYNLGNVHHQKKEIIFKKIVDKNIFIANISRKIYHFFKFSENQADKKYLKELQDLADKIVIDKKIEVVITSSSPTIYHQIGKKLRNENKILWVADLRDLWSKNPTYSYFKRLSCSLIERETLKSADLITTVSDDLKNKLQMDYVDVITIRNGYDPQEYKCKSRKIKKRVFIYAGNLYFKYQNPEILLKALKNLNTRHQLDNCNFKFYISNLWWFKELVKKYGLENKIIFKDLVSSKKISQVICNSDAVIVFNWEDNNQKGIIPLKLYEGIGAKKTIFAIGGYKDTEAQKIINDINAGYYVTNCEELECALLQFINSKKVKKYNSAKYSYVFCAKKLDKNIRAKLNSLV